uniref:Uncharacterized protein n=1 Tax=Anguilla anguilla TaxID=7936 RepID=A0A0E9WYX2_ANGAN
MGGRYRTLPFCCFVLNGTHLSNNEWPKTFTRIPEYLNIACGNSAIHSDIENSHPSL